MRGARSAVAVHGQNLSMAKILRPAFSGFGPDPHTGFFTFNVVISGHLISNP